MLLLRALGAFHNRSIFLCVMAHEKWISKKIFLSKTDSNRLKWWGWTICVYNYFRTAFPSLKKQVLAYPGRRRRGRGRRGLHEKTGPLTRSCTRAGPSGRRPRTSCPAWRTTGSDLSNSRCEPTTTTKQSVYRRIVVDTDHSNAPRKWSEYLMRSKPWSTF